MMTVQSPDSMRRLASRIVAVAAAGVGSFLCPAISHSQIQTDVVILADGSSSVDTPCLFEFEKDAIGNLLCGTDCATCSSTHVPHDGTLALAVLQFAGNIQPGGVRIEVPLTIVDGSGTAATLCGHIREHDPDDMLQAGGSTPLEEALLKARDILENSTTGAPDRLVIILSDQCVYGTEDQKRQMANILLEMCAPPRVIAYRFSDDGIGSGSDPDCEYPLDWDVLAWLSNPVELSAFDPYKPIGDYLCRVLCNVGNCGTYPNNCYFTSLDPDPIEEFVDFVVNNICALQSPTQVFTQQTLQSVENPVTLGTEVTFSVAVSASEADVYYQWQRNGVDITDFGRFAGATTDQLSVDDVVLCDGGIFRCRVWTPCLSILSDPLTMVIDGDGAPDCDNHALGDGIPDECQLVPSHLWAGAVANPDVSDWGEGGKGIAANAAGDVAYVGTIINLGHVTVDLNPLRGCADVDLRGLPGSSAQDALTTLLLRVGNDYAYGWSALYNGNEDDEDDEDPDEPYEDEGGIERASCVAFDYLGNVYVAGTRLEGDYADVFVLKYDAAGEELL